MMGPP